MTEITGVVGESGVNASRDVMLVQAMLQAIPNAEGTPYHDSRYDGIWGPITRAAIAAFQRDHGLSEVDYGHVTPSSETLRRMIELLPIDRSDMRILLDTRIVYLAASQQQINEGRASVGSATFRHGFETKVRNLIQEMYNVHAIALAVDLNKGHFRSFRVQADIRSDVGPGESYHNYGLAADVYFFPLQFIRPDGTQMAGGPSILPNLRDLNRPAWVRFWETRNLIARRHGLFDIGADDRPHLQSDHNKPAGRSLVALLNRHGTMKWDFRGPKPNVYKCDLGLGGKLVEVGKAVDIWRGWANVTTNAIAQAQGVKSAEVDPKAAQRLKQTLRDEFTWAENHWRDWKPI